MIQPVRRPRLAGIHPRGSDINLQATIAAQSAVAEPTPEPHHPIMCQGDDCPLFLHEDGRFACLHTEVPPGDTRTKHALDHSIAVLILECAAREFG